MANQYFGTGRGTGSTTPRMQVPGPGARLASDAGLSALATKTPRLRSGRRQAKKLTNKVSNIQAGM